ncbi:SLC16A12 [Bugula neritina]|uniref:SLC16A12 n=1 Tax=Bugula neritina TaxID=10212 RepID=A0A7J7J779_BUGNE|nr:SLC16A12 [Bugula neritina]
MITSWQSKRCTLHCPVAGYALTRVQHRIVGAVGMVLISSGYVLLAYAPNIYVLCVATSLVGLGVGFSFMAMIWTATIYFEEKKATAVGLVTAGAGVGTFALPSFCRVLFDNFTYQETMIFIAGTVMQSLLLLMLIRPESYWKTSKQSSNNELVEGKYKSGNKLNVSTVSLSVIEDETGNQQNEFQNSNCQSYQNAKDFDESKNSSSKLKSSASLKFMLRLFFTNKMFLTYMLSSCLLIQGFASSFAVFPLYAEELGIAKYHVSTAFIVYGVIEIPSKILQGILANQKLVSALFQLGVSSIGAGCSILLAAVWAKKEAFYVSFLFLGFFFSAVMSLPPLVILERFDTKVASFGSGLILSGQCLATVLSFGITPIIRAKSGSWSAVLYYIVGTLLFAGIMNIITSKIFPVEVKLGRLCELGCPHTTTAAATAAATTAATAAATAAAATAAAATAAATAAAATAATTATAAATAAAATAAAPTTYTVLACLIH